MRIGITARYFPLAQMLLAAAGLRSSLTEQVSRIRQQGWLRIRNRLVRRKETMKALALSTSLLFASLVGAATPATASIKADDGHARSHHSAIRQADRHRHGAPSFPKPQQVGTASYYSNPQPLASRGRFNPSAMTAAHKTLPFGTRVRVTHLGSGRSVEVLINDRGPYVGGRIIDLSKGAASAIGMTDQGIARIGMTVLGR
jgi:rare lipoprotein A